MSPFLDSEIHFEEEQIAKYVTVNGHVYYSNAKGQFIYVEKHSTLALRAGATIGPNRKPIVDDAGMMSFLGGKFRFSDRSTTCGGTIDKEITRSIAKNILGEDKVY